MKKWFKSLENKAENMICQDLPDIPDLSDEDIRKILHELRVCKIELELKNEELLRTGREIEKAQKQLQASKEKYMELFEFAPAGYVILNYNFEIDNCNTVFAEITGLPYCDIINRYLSDFIHPDFQDAFHLVNRKLIHSSDKQKLDLKIITPDRADLWINVEIIPRDNNRSYWMTVSDITKRKHSEQELKNARKAADAANRAKSEFLANMSHEIRTPMNAVLGFADVIGGIIRDKQAIDYLDLIRINGYALISLIDDILELSEIEAGKMRLINESFSLCSVFHDVEKMFSRKITDKNLKFILDIDPELPDYIVLDKIRLRLILFNLVGNAVKFTDSGHISVSVRALKNETDKDSIDLLISIEDTGIGISEDHKKLIFKAFEQQDNSSSRKYGGTGLGLAIVSRLAEMMNSRITVSSKKGEGSIFKLFIRDVRIPAKKDAIKTWSADSPGSCPVQQGEYVSQPCTIDLKGIKKLSKLICILETGFRPLWERIKDALILDDIKYFAVGLKQAGEDFSFSPLYDYGDRLYKHARNYNISEIKTMVTAFPELTENIKTMFKNLEAEA